MFTTIAKRLRSVLETALNLRLDLTPVAALAMIVAAALIATAGTSPLWAEPRDTGQPPPPKTPHNPSNAWSSAS